MAETTYDRTKAPKRFTAAVSRGLRESAVLAIGVIALVMLIALLTYHREDAGFSSTGGVEQQVSNGIVDAFVHVLEQYLTYPAGGVLSDRLAEALLITLTEQGPRALREPTNYEVRANLMWAASLSLNGLIGQGVPQDWTTHHIGHELTALFGLDHARSLAVVLPAVLEARRQQKAEKLLQFAARVFAIRGASDAEIIDTTIAQTVAFFESLGIPTRLSAYGIGEDAIPQVAAKLKANRRLRMGERLDITPDAAGKILALAL